MNKIIKKLFAPIAVLSLALGVTISVNNHNEVGAEAATANWVLVTSINDFVDGGEYLFTHSDSTSYMVPGAYTGSNPTSAALDLNTIARNQAWTLDNVGTNQWQIFNGSNYLKIQADSTKSLRTQATVPDTHFTITVGATENTFKFPTSATGINRAPARYTGGSDWRSYATTEATTSLTIYKYVDIVVSPLTNLTKSGTLTKTQYYVNDAFDPSGLIFTATYQDAHTAVVTSSVTYNPSVMAANTTQVIASYTENSVTKSVTITGITVTVPAWSVATYTISAKDTFTTTGDVPTGSSAGIVETYSTSKQMTSGNSQTVTFTNYNHIKISQITLSAKSNTSSGAGNFSYSLNGGTSYIDIIPTAAFNTTGWYGSWSTSYVDVVKNVDILVSSSIIFKVAATANSLYVESYDIRWEVDPDYVAAQTFATDVMTGVGANANANCAVVLDQLQTSYNGLNSNAKAYFDSLSEFGNARARIAYLEAWVTANPGATANPLDLSSNTPITLIIGILGLTAVAGFYLVSKKRYNN